MFRSVLVFSLSLVLLCSLAVHGTSTTTKAPDNKLSEAGWALAGAGLNALADSLNGEGVRYDPVVANEQLPPVPTSGCRPSPQNMDFRFAFEISSSQVKRLVTEAGMNAMIPPLPAGENGNFHQLLKENFGQKLFKALADAVPDAGIGLVLGTFKGNDLLGSDAISNSKMGLLGVNHKKSKEPSIYELIEDAYQGTDPSLTAFGQFISRDEKGRFIARVNNNEHGLEELNEATKASVLRAYDTLLDNSGADLELKHSLISGPKVFSQWPRMIPHTAAKLIQNDHHDLSAFIRTVHHIINHTEAGVFAHRNHSKSHTHTLSSEKKSPLDFFRTNGLSDLNCNTIPVDPNHNYFITGIFASLPGVGDFKFCFALNTCDQMGGIAFTPAPIGQFLPPPLDVIVETIEDFSVAVSLKSYLSLTFVPFWVGESRPEFHATMGGTLGTHILISIPKLTFLPEKFQKVFGLKLNGLVMYDLDPNHDGGLAASLTDIFSNPKPSAMFTKLIEALKNQKDLAIGIKTYGELTLKLSELSHGILPDLTVGAMGQLMLAVNVKESSSLSNGLFFRSQASAGDVARFIEKLLNTLSAGALKKQVHKIMEKIAQNLVTKLDIFLKGHDGSWGIRIQLGQLILSAEYFSDDRFKLCANGHCLTVPFLVCIKDKQDFVGTPMSCKKGFEEVAGLCATKCETGFKRIGFLCVFQNCKTGYSDNGANCVTNEVGYPPTHCPAETERIGSSCFESCRPGYISEGEICAKPCPANHTLDGSGLSCVSSIVRDHYPRTSSSMSCRPGEERIGSSCFQPCSAGYISDGSACIKSCPINYNYTIDSSGVKICKSSQSTHRLVRISSPQSPSTCSPLDERIGSSCYPPCFPGYFSQGTFCIQSCPPNSALGNSGQDCVSRIPRKNVYRSWSAVLPDGNCRPGEVRQGSSCLTSCPSGYVSQHPADILCVEPCPSGYYDAYAYEYCESRMLTHRYDRSLSLPPTSTSCPPNEERIGSSCYRQCPSGYLSQGSFCVSACPANHTLDGSGLSCVSSIVRDHYPRTSSSMSCRPGEERIGSSCFQPCSPGEERIGSSCFQPCSPGYFSQGTFCIQSCPPNSALGNSGQDCVSRIPRVLYHRSFVPTLLKCPIGKALSEELCYSILPRFYPKQQSVVAETLICPGGTQRLSETDHLCYPSRCASGYDWSYDRKHTTVHCKSHCPDNFEHDHGDTCCHSKFPLRCDTSPKLRCDTSNPNTGALIDENL